MTDRYFDLDFELGPVRLYHAGYLPQGAKCVLDPSARPLGSYDYLSADRLPKMFRDAMRLSYENDMAPTPMAAADSRQSGLERTGRWGRSEYLPPHGTAAGALSLPARAGEGASRPYLRMDRAAEPGDPFCRFSASGQTDTESKGRVLQGSERRKTQPPASKIQRD
ncbi:MAG: hypothetical protein DBY24_09460 [Prevotellaceae bacterium]|nr:MAG: hypothetical protein DBY24_09460 [Prevotellaceae bacterium]